VYSCLDARFHLGQSSPCSALNGAKGMCAPQTRPASAPGTGGAAPSRRCCNFPPRLVDPNRWAVGQMQIGHTKEHQGRQAKSVKIWRPPTQLPCKRLYRFRRNTRGIDRVPNRAWWTLPAAGRRGVGSPTRRRPPHQRRGTRPPPAVTQTQSSAPPRGGSPERNPRLRKSRLSIAVFLSRIIAAIHIDDDDENVYGDASR